MDAGSSKPTHQPIDETGGRNQRHGTNDLGQPVGPSVEIELPRPVPSVASMIGRTCRIDPLDPALHGDALFEAYSAAPDVRGFTYLYHGPFDSLDAFRGWLESLDGSTDPLYFVISDAAGPCGMAAYLRIAPQAASIEVGSIHFAHRLQQTVASTEAMLLMMQRAFDAGYRRYEWKCDALNAPSRAAAQRLGFSYEGTFRQAAIYKGRSRDTAWFSMLDSEWPERRSEFERWLDPSNFDTDASQLTPLRH
ncbi:MAG: GNAT family N-acetyltransferase [Ilumatobacter sp.]